MSFGFFTAVADSHFTSDFENGISNCGVYLSSEVINHVVFARDFLLLCALLVFTFCFPSITSTLGSLSISLSEDGEGGTEPCEGPYMNVRV